MSGGSVTLRVDGLRELERSLVQMEKAAPRIISEALRTPMESVRDEAKALVPKRTGELADAIDLTPVRRASARRASMADTLSEVGLRIKKPAEGKVGTWGGGDGGRLNPRYYWHLVEFGTAHSAAHPYIRPAFDNNQRRLVDGFATIARRRVEETAARYASRRARGRR